MIGGYNIADLLPRRPITRLAIGVPESNLMRLITDLNKFLRSRGDRERYPILGFKIMRLSTFTFHNGPLTTSSIRDLQLVRTLQQLDSVFRHCGRLEDIDGFELYLQVINTKGPKFSDGDKVAGEIRTFFLQKLQATSAKFRISCGSEDWIERL